MNQQNSNVVYGPKGPNSFTLLMGQQVGKTEVIQGPAGPNSFVMYPDLKGGVTRLADEEDAALESWIGVRTPNMPTRVSTKPFAFVEKNHAVVPVDAAERKALPVYSGFVKYFPKAIAAVAELSRKGNDQHNPGKPLHWDRSKSGDEKDALVRHLLDAGTFDIDGVRHSTKVAWRAMANLEKELEQS